MSCSSVSWSNTSTLRWRSRPLSPRAGGSRSSATARNSGALRSRYTENIEYLGRVTDDELTGLYQRAAALVVPNVEEFGITAVEAQAAGRPVVAMAAGGACETVIHGRTGILVSPGDSEALAEALRTDFSRFDAREIRAHAQLFSRSVFEARMSEIVAGASAGRAFDRPRPRFRAGARSCFRTARRPVRRRGAQPARRDWRGPSRCPRSARPMPAWRSSAATRTSCRNTQPADGE